MKKLFLKLFCNIDENGFKKYTIRKGWHRSGFRFRRTSRNHFYFKVIFDESAKYKSKNPENQLDVNKLWGISDCGNYHMKSSIRFGWRWKEGEGVEILWFKHQEGEFYFGKIKTVPINKEITFELDICEDYYVLTVDKISKYTQRICLGDYTRYKLYPYFGGDEVAPHKITIKIKE